MKIEVATCRESAVAAMRRKPRRIVSSNVLLSIALCLGFVYCLLPTESSGVNVGLNVYFRALVASVIAALVAVRYKPRINILCACYLGVLFLVSIMAALFSFSNYLFLLWLSVGFGLTLAAAAAKDAVFRSALARAILALIVFSGLALALQLALYAASGVSVDLHQIIFPFSEARIADHVTFLRFGGVYIEPGTLAQWIYLEMLVYLALSQNAKSYVIAFVATTMLLTASTWGVGVALLLTVVALARASSHERLLVIVALSVLIFVLIEVAPTADVFDFFDAKITFETESVGYKGDTYDQFFRALGGMVFIGQGFVPDFCHNCLSVQDAGLGLNMVVVMGLVFATGTCLLYFYSIIRGGDFWFAVMSIPLVFTKAFFWDFLVWLLFFVVITAPKSEPKRKEPNVAPKFSS